MHWKKGEHVPAPASSAGWLQGRAGLWQHKFSSAKRKILRLKLPVTQESESYSTLVKLLSEKFVQMLRQFPSISITVFKNPMFAAYKGEKISSESECISQGKVARLELGHPNTTTVNRWDHLTILKSLKNLGTVRNISSIHVH